MPTFLGDIAQLVEQRTENPCVAGSIPAGTTSTAIALAKEVIEITLREIWGFFDFTPADKIIINATILVL